MKVSIIIPVYNVSNYIERCLLSALNQTFLDIEILLIDDCGQDNSILLAEAVIARHPRGNKAKFLFHEKNRGLSAARNTGIEAARGDYLYFLDSDDEITISCVEELVDMTNHLMVDFVIADYDVIGSQKSYPPLLLDAGMMNGNEAILNAYVCRRWYMMAFNKLVNRSFLINNHLFFEEGLIHEDDLWSFQLACVATTMIVVKSKTYKYHIREGSITHTNLASGVKHRIKIMELMNKYVEENYYMKMYDVYNFLEGNTLVFFFRYNKFISLKENVRLYKSLRFLHLKKLEYGCFFKRILRDYHYNLPFFLGFIYFRLYIVVKYRVLKMEY